MTLYAPFKRLHDRFRNSEDCCGCDDVPATICACNNNFAGTPPTRADAKFLKIWFSGLELYYPNAALVPPLGWPSDWQISPQAVMSTKATIDIINSGSFTSNYGVIFNGLDGFIGVPNPNCNIIKMRLFPETTNAVYQTYPAFAMGFFENGDLVRTYNGGGTVRRHYADLTQPSLSFATLYDLGGGFFPGTTCRFVSTALNACTSQQNMRSVLGPTGKQTLVDASLATASLRVMDNDGHFVPGPTSGSYDLTVPPLLTMGGSYQFGYDRYEAAAIPSPLSATVTINPGIGNPWTGYSGTMSLGRQDTFFGWPAIEGGGGITQRNLSWRGTATAPSTDGGGNVSIIVTLHITTSAGGGGGILNPWIPPGAVTYTAYVNASAGRGGTNFGGYGPISNAIASTWPTSGLISSPSAADLGLGTFNAGGAGSATVTL